MSRKHKLSLERKKPKCKRYYETLPKTQEGGILRQFRKVLVMSKGAIREMWEAGFWMRSSKETAQRVDIEMREDEFDLAMTISNDFLKKRLDKIESIAWELVTKT